MTDCIIVTNSKDWNLLCAAGVDESIIDWPSIPVAGSKDYSKQIQEAVPDWTMFDQYERVIMAGHENADVRYLERELVRRIGVEKCLYPLGAKAMKPGQFLTDLFADKAPEDIRFAVGEGATHYPVEGVFDFKSAAPNLLDFYRNGPPARVSTGWPTFDQHYKVGPGELTVVTGMPGHGKSEWLDALCVNLAQSQGWRVAYYTPENEPFELHQAKLLEKIVRRPFLEGPHPRMSEADIKLAVEWCNETFFYLMPEEQTLESILDRARVCILRHGVSGVVLDPWNYIEHSRPRDMSQEEYQSFSIGRLAAFAKRHQIHLWVVAHPKKMERNKDGERPIPGLYDISGSAHWFNKCDNGITVHRDFSLGPDDKPSDKVDVHILKVRHKATGCVGKETFRYDRLIGTYTPSY